MPQLIKLAPHYFSTYSLCW